MVQHLRSRVVLTVVLVTVLAAAFAAVAGARSGDEGVAAPTEPAHFVVYYFHGDVRCATCRKLEAYSEEAITTGFADELERGALVFRAVNVDQAPNKHFVKDFQLTTKAVVVVEYEDGKPVRHTNLAKVWQLVRDKDDFVRYVQEETRTFLDGA